MTEMICDRETDCRRRYVVKLSDEDRGWINTLIRFDMHHGQNQRNGRTYSYAKAVTTFEKIRE
jgi:hypothetical protein